MKKTDLDLILSLVAFVSFSCFSLFNFIGLVCYSAQGGNRIDFKVSLLHDFFFVIVFTLVVFITFLFRITAKRKSDSVKDKLDLLLLITIIFAVPVIDQGFNLFYNCYAERLYFIALGFMFFCLITVTVGIIVKCVKLSKPSKD